MATERTEGRERERSPDRTSRVASTSPSSPTRTGRGQSDPLRNPTEQARRFQQAELQSMVVQQGQMMQQQQSALQQIITTLTEMNNGQHQRDVELMTLRRQLEEVRMSPLIPPGLNMPGGTFGNGQSDPFAAGNPSTDPSANGQQGVPGG